MRNAEILASRVAADVAPWLWGFAYPVHGRGLVLARAMALRLWCVLLRRRLRREGLC